MSFQTGDRLGPYEITSKIGAGGMGEVYRAHDTRLNREVAIKVSADRFSDRFEREARAVAALNHPNICTLYDVGPDYLVMEYVEGENLRGPLPLDEALRVARQIADALEEAHAKGVVHRDLKPGNIKVKPDGAVKVLDFGLAKMGGTPAAPSQDSPTISLAATQAGVVLGTAAYMSPEQARGKAVDKRTDIWAFGVVLYELLTGKPLFQGEDLTDTLAAVVRKEPDWQQLPTEVRRLLKACLEKDPRQRLRDVTDAWRLLDESPARASTTPSRSRLAILTGGAAAVFAIVAAAIGLVHFRETTPEPAVVRFEVSAPAGTVMADIPPAVSPDSSSLAFVARGDDGRTRVWIRSLDSVQARVLTGTEGVSSPGVFWSPDSRSIGFVAGGVLQTMAVSGGPPVALDKLGAWAGGTWNRDGVILVGGPRGVRRISQGGGAAEFVTKTEVPTESAHAFPHFLPDGRHFFYLAASNAFDGGTIFLATLDGGTRERLVAGASRFQFAPPRTPGDPGHLFYVRGGTLLVQPLASDTYRPAGDPFPAASHVGTAFGGLLGFFSVSTGGALVYRSGATAGGLRLTWFDREGRSLGAVGPTGEISAVTISSGGAQVAFAFQDAESAAPDIWLMDARQGVPSRFTSTPGVDSAPVWSPDERRLAFTSDRGGTWGEARGFRQDITGVGTAEQVLKAGVIRDWSPDGRYLLYDDEDPSGAARLWMLALEGDRKPVPFPHDRFNEALGQFAPRAAGEPPGPPRWIAYTSNESGDYEIYVQSFPPGRKFRISTGGGTSPRWRRDGKELFYQAPGGSMMAVDVQSAPQFEHGAPRELFKVPIARAGFMRFAFPYDVSPDGKRFLVITRPEAPEAVSTPMTVVLNWQAAVKE